MENNITTAQLVKKHLENNVFLLDYLKRDLINVTSLARELLPLIQKDNPKASLESISIAIKRLQLSGYNITKQLRKVCSNIQISMRTNVVLFCLKKGARLPDVSTFDPDDVFFLNQGSNEITIILDKKNAHLVKGDILFKQDDLAIISLKDTLLHEKENYRTTPGFVHVFISNISKRGINISDILSTYSQLTIVVEQKYLLDVYKICQDVVNLKYL